MRIDLRGNESANGIVNICVFYDTSGFELVRACDCKIDEMVKIAYLELTDKRGATPHVGVVTFSSISIQARQLIERGDGEQLCVVCSADTNTLGGE
jgi:hypothetical protein